MLPKIVFLLGKATNSHSKNRVEEFIANGFDVQVYGFTGGNNLDVDCTSFPVEIVGGIEDGNYLSRLSLYLRTFRRIKNRHRNEDVVFYIFGLDKAIFFTLLGRKVKYIYEEADLVHTYLGSRILRYAFERLDKIVISRSLQTVLTSDGFVQYHFGCTKPENVVVVSNRLNVSVQTLAYHKKRKFDREHIKIGFVGWPRFESVLSFIKIFCSEFPQHEFHVYGAPVSKEFQELTKYPNYFLHGKFQNPVDLPNIYANIDLVLSTYDVRFENVKYAEPNKIYESIYFETPIIVSDGTFLAEKVDALNIGFHINALDSNNVVAFIKGLSLESISEKIANIKKIDKIEAVNINDRFFSNLKILLHSQKPCVMKK